MRVLLNMGSSRGMGSGTVGLNVLREFTSAGQDEVTAFIPQGWPQEHLRDLSPATLVRAEGGNLNKLVGENVTLRKIMRRNRIQVLFSLTDTSTVRCPIPHVLLVQQPFLAYGPDDRDFELPAAVRWRVRLIEAYFRAGLPTVTRLTVQTQSMSKRLQQRWGLPSQLIWVIPSALPSGISFVHWTPDRTATAYVVYPAHGDEYKNHVVLAEMLRCLAAQGSPLQCCVTTTPDEVPDFYKACKRRGVLSLVQFVGRVSSERVRDLMMNAIALVNPSKMESFGLTYYEAMAVGCPVVAADKDFAREACGPAALYCDADSGWAFAQAISALLEADEGERLSKLGKERMRTTARNWTTIVSEYRLLLRDVVRRSNGHPEPGF